MYRPRGMSLIDVVVGIALVVLVFLTLFGLLRASLQLSTLIKAESTASAIASSQIEYIRSLPYSAVGTVGGIPAGLIPQNATTTEGGISYGVRTFIDYYDDPVDGKGAADTNGITTDYKRIKVTVSYNTVGKTRQFVLISNFSPPGLETTLGGGTLQIIVVNAVGAPVPGASVHIINASTTPTVDLTTFSDSTGIVYLPGAATSTQYQVVVSKAGYSTAQTYLRGVPNANPTPGYLTVALSQTTTSTFAIDLLGTLDIHTYSVLPRVTFNDYFPDASQLSSQTGTVVSAGTIILSGGAGSYGTTGTVISVPQTPTNIIGWLSASSTSSLPAGTTAVFQFLDGSGTLIPDTVLPGNLAGFGPGYIDFRSVSTSTYPTLELSATLTSTDPNVTPAITGWSLTYQPGLIPLPNIPFTLKGTKTIGTTDVGATIPKTVQNATTDSSGAIQLPLEWDSYSLSLPSKDIINACNMPPYPLAPGSFVTESLTLGPSTANSLLVLVNDNTGNTVAGALVTLANEGVSKTATSTSCGSAYFGGVSPANDYSLTLTKPGYTSNTTNGLTVSGQTFYAASF